LTINGPARKRAILYARVYTEEQARSGYSLAQQLEALGDYVAREAYEVLEEVRDAGQSGASQERPGMDRGCDLVAGGGVREPAYRYLLRQQFAGYGTRLKALNGHGDDNPENQPTDGIVGELAKYERARTSEKTRETEERKG
jgi:site-specific DNA recombinase